MSCMPVGHKWARMEYLLWWRSGQDLPPLVTTSPDGTPRATAGVLGFDTTAVLLGDETVGMDARPGGRVSVGTWLDAAGCHGVEGRFFSLGNSLVSYTADSDGSPILARPFLNGTAPASQLLAYPNFTTSGSVLVQGESDVLGGDVLYRWLAGQVGSTRLDFTIGYQFAAWARV